VIAGDRSLVSLIAHELAHSWSGNLVTNVDWNHFWLNEGFTSYVENRIIEALFGTRRADMERVLSQRSLQLELAELAPVDQHLVLDLKGRDPDDGMSAVAYDKGHWLLRTLEQRYGRELFDPFLRGWFDRGAFASVDTNDFVAYLRSQLMAPHPGRFSEDELNAWLYQSGVPAHAIAARSEAFEAVDAQRDAWLAGTLPLDQIDVADWSTQEWLRFLDGLPDELDGARLEQLDERFKFTGTGNAEVAFLWYVKAIRAGHAPIRPSLNKFLVAIGRRKFVLPLYQELAKRGDAELEFARSVYAKARPGYHPITRASVDPVLQR
jgi:aminopeptidase N